MTELSKVILDNHKIRKSRAQKARFFETLKKELPSLGYEPYCEQGGFGNNSNIIAGDIKKAKVIFTAHYDTCAVLPFPNFVTPKNMPVYLLYSLLVGVGFIIAEAIFVAAAMALGIDGIFLFVLMYVFLIAMMLVLYIGPANKNNYNDNTSGVVTLIEAMAALPAELRENAAFIFFDNEEKGLLGSAYFARKHKEDTKDKLIVNFDCVSDGDHIMFCASKTLSANPELYDIVRGCYPCEKNGKFVLTETSKSVFYPSDQKHFKNNVAVAALNKAPVIGYYLSRIHTAKDTVFDKKNIELLRDFVLRLTEKIQ